MRKASESLAEKVANQKFDGTVIYVRQQVAVKRKQATLASFTVYLRSIVFTEGNRQLSKHLGPL